MAVKLRMSRIGRRHRPFFRINAVDGRTPGNGKILEKIGHYDPIEKNIEKQIVLNTERVKYWLDKGAIPSDSVSQILLRKGISNKYAEQEKIKRQKARKIARARGKLFTKAEKLAAQKAEEEEEKAKAEEAKAQQEKAKAEETKAEQEKAKAEEAKAQQEKAKAEETKAEQEKTKAEEVKTEKEKPVKEEKPKAEEAKAEQEKTKAEEAKPEKAKPAKEVKAEDKEPKAGQEKTEESQ